MIDINEEFDNEYLLTSDKSKMQPAAIHAYLAGESYWAKDIPYETVYTSFEHSWCIAVLHNGAQVAYARLVTDYSVFAYLADVYVLESHRGKGLSRKMMAAIMSLPFVKGVRRLTLATRDAHGLYAQFGFKPVEKPERLMEIARPDMYTHADAKPGG